MKSLTNDKASQLLLDQTWNNDVFFNDSAELGCRPPWINVYDGG
jgi:hypothetical protein